jgi:hypothetical protein
VPSLEELRHSFQGGLRCDPRGPAIGEAFNIMVDAVVRELMQLLREEMHLEGEELDEIMETRFAIFYVDDTHIASRDSVFLQKAIGGLVTTFKHVGLETITKMMQAMTCMPSNIRLQLPAESYQRMRTRRTPPAADWDAHTVTCREYRKDMRASSLRHHLADLHEIYQQQVVAEELLYRREGVV